MNVLITSTTFIPSVILCGHSQLDYLEKQGKLNYKFVISHFTNSENIKWADIIIFLRSDSDIDAYVAKLAKKAHKHLVYVLDDDILNVPSYLSSAPYYLLPSTQKNIKIIMSYCDTFLTTSPVLKEKYGNMFKNVFLINEPSLNRIDTKPENKKVKIGFAGSIDRAQDLNQILEGTIEKLVNTYKESIEIEIMGAKPEFVDKYNLKHLPYQDGYDAYTAYMSKCNWDIGLAPMPDTNFHKCKYFNKYVEYASFGIAGVYSNLEPYVYGIKNEVNGLLVNNTTEEWFYAISRLIEDKKLRKTISSNCLKEANDKYTLENCSCDYLEKITKGYTNQLANNNIPSLEPYKFILFFKRIFRKVKQEGFKFPSWLIKKISKKIDDKKSQIKDISNLKKINEIIKNRKPIVIIAPYVEEPISDYDKRVKYVDTKFNDYFRIYISGEDRLCEHLLVNFVDKDHVTITFNSYDINQTNQILEIISKTHYCLIHSIIRFTRERISNDMFKLFDLEDVEVIWDTHGMVPEEYHEKANYHTEDVLNEIEKTFYDKADILICENDKLVKHFRNKYNKEKDYTIY